MQPSHQKHFDSFVFLLCGENLILAVFLLYSMAYTYVKKKQHFFLMTALM